MELFSDNSPEVQAATYHLFSRFHPSSFSMLVLSHPCCRKSSQIHCETIFITLYVGIGIGRFVARYALSVSTLDAADEGK